MDVGQDTTGGDGDAAQQLAQLLIVAHSQLDVPGDDAGLLVVIRAAFPASSRASRQPGTPALLLGTLGHQHQDTAGILQQGKVRWSESCWRFRNTLGICKLLHRQTMFSAASMSSQYETGSPRQASWPRRTWPGRCQVRFCQ